MSIIHRPAFSPVLLTGQIELPEHPEARALLFVECIAHGVIAWEVLLAFHCRFRASPVSWPRSFAESYSMLRLAVAMTDRFGDRSECGEVTRSLAHHLFDRDPHPDLVTIVQDALPLGVSLLLTPSSRLSS